MKSTKHLKLVMLLVYMLGLVIFYSRQLLVFLFVFVDLVYRSRICKLVPHDRDVLSLFVIWVDDVAVLLEMDKKKEKF